MKLTKGIKLLLVCLICVGTDIVKLFEYLNTN